MYLGVKEQMFEEKKFLTRGLGNSEIYVREILERKHIET
jgi:hypothetical protein